MILTDKEYRRALRQLDEERERVEGFQAQLEGERLPAAQAQRLMAPLLSRLRDSEEEVAAYEQLKQGRLPPCENLRGLGRLLIGVRVALGLTQREFARRLGVHPSQVSRDERNEYHGVTIDRAAAILARFDVQLASTLRAPIAALPQTGRRKPRTQAA